MNIFGIGTCTKGDAAYADPNVQFEINSGTIENNHAVEGGAIFTEEGTELVLIGSSSRPLVRVVWKPFQPHDCWGWCDYFCDATFTGCTFNLNTAYRER